MRAKPAKFFTSSATDGTFRNVHQTDFRTEHRDAGNEPEWPVTCRGGAPLQGRFRKTEWHHAPEERPYLNCKQQCVPVISSPCFLPGTASAIHATLPLLIALPKNK